MWCNLVILYAKPILWRQIRYSSLGFTDVRFSLKIVGQILRIFLDCCLYFSPTSVISYSASLRYLFISGNEVAILYIFIYSSCIALSSMSSFSHSHPFAKSGLHLETSSSVSAFYFLAVSLLLLLFLLHPSSKSPTFPLRYSFSSISFLGLRALLLDIFSSLRPFIFCFWLPFLVSALRFSFSTVPIRVSSAFHAPSCRFFASLISSHSS